MTAQAPEHPAPTTLPPTQMHKIIVSDPVPAEALSILQGIAKRVEDGTAAIAELSFSGRQGEHIKVLENRAGLHNVVVCTLCSCYPWPVLGLPPVWYKSAPYRSRVVIEPRAVLEEFGLTLPQDTQIRVWDSTAELRYLVLPQRPEGTEGMSEDELAQLVTRDSMIGTGLALSPANAVTGGVR